MTNQTTDNPNPSINLTMVYRDHNVPTVFTGEMFTAHDANSVEYICCQANPDRLPGHYVATKVPDDFRQRKCADEIAYWTLLMTSKPGKWFTATTASPADGIILFLEPQDGEPADSGCIPQPPPVPPD